MCDNPRRLLSLGDPNVTSNFQQNTQCPASPLVVVAAIAENKGRRYSAWHYRQGMADDFDSASEKSHLVKDVFG